MSKAEKEQAIIKNIKALESDGYGQYHIYRSICTAIGRGMGYISEKENAFQIRAEDEPNVHEIFRRMEEKGILKASKSGNAFRLNI